MWVLLGCSIFAVAIFFERSFFFHRSTTSVHHLLKGLANLIKNKNYAEALHEAAGSPGPVARVIHAAIIRHSASRADLKEVVQEAGQLEVPRLERYLPVLLSIAFVAPLIGLLGTVVGLIETFERVTQASTVTPLMLGEGVNQSLITTASGLAVAIPAYLMYAYLAARSRSLLHDMERGGIEIVNLIIDSREAGNDEIVEFAAQRQVRRKQSGGSDEAGK
jgi:biopolymer transport protein ExbB